MTADAANASDQRTTPRTLPVHNFAPLEIALDVRAGEPRGLELFLREQLDLITDVRRPRLRRIAVRHQRARTHGLAELDRGDVAVAAGRALLAILVFREADNTENPELAGPAVGR